MERGSPSCIRRCGDAAGKIDGVGAGYDTGAAETHVDIDQDIDRLAAPGDCSEQIDLKRVVDDNGDAADFLAGVDQTGDRAGRTDRCRQEDAGNSGIGQRFNFAHSGRACADGAGLGFVEGVEHALDDVVGARLVGRIEVARFGRRLERADDHACGVGAQIEHLPIDESGMHQVSRVASGS